LNYGIWNAGKLRQVGLALFEAAGGIQNLGSLDQTGAAVFGSTVGIGTGVGAVNAPLHVESASGTEILIKTLKDTAGETASLSFPITSGTTLNGFSIRSADIKVTRVTGNKYDMEFFCSDSATNQKYFAITGMGNIVAGIQAAITTNAVDGFLYIPTCAGTPTGVPTAYTGKCAMVMDTTNHILYVYDGSWRAMN
jgi:hypothetical protein